LLAAKKLNMDTVPVVRLDHLSETQKKAYILADNRLGEVGGTEWDLDLVSLELEGLQELDFDIDLTGFSLGDIQPEETEGLTDGRWQEFTGKQAVHEQTSVLYNNIQTVEYKEATHG